MKPHRWQRHKLQLQADKAQRLNAELDAAMMMAIELDNVKDGKHGATARRKPYLRNEMG